ncbi:major capsid protein [Moraxella bovis]|uniref:major capsid protein n=1 Tax=Moraxella bovis TaxID=476 RepID=UPI000992C652|nr:major capsid protein [Moraxella bovis]OOR88740.1 hypothetical protein B0182_09595 [Moraxella bovis]UZA16039.1 major capsid protein [Moraxella bovis]UZA16537.1 major capsid protein [Moraxella bovis]
MSKTYDEKGNELVAQTQKQGLMSRVVPASVLGSVAVMATSANAATLDLSSLTTELQGVQTAVVGVVAVAITIGIAIVGWKWAKRALFSV